MTRAFWDIVYKKGHFLAKFCWTMVGYGRRVRDVFRAHSFDGVYIFLWVTPFRESVFCRLIRRVSRKVVYDIDDWIFLTKVSEANRSLGFLKKSPAQIDSIIRTADHVITCTPFLDGYARKLNDRTTDISSTVDTDAYWVKTGHDNDHVLVLGWSGSHSTAPYLHLLDSVLKDLSREMRFRLLVIGAPPDFGIEGVDVEVLPWRSDSEVQDLARIDIGLYPLPEDSWVKGKSGLKAIQYMALGIPPVATAAGCNARVIEDGVSGFLVANEEEWKSRIRALAADPGLRRRVGAEARRVVESRFSVKANQSVYLDVFRHVYGNPNLGGNLDAGTVDGFGLEWTVFDHSKMEESELRAMFEQYFAGFPWGKLPPRAAGFDLGCGTGRWARFVAEKGYQLHLIDASPEVLAVARRNLARLGNCRFHLASVERIPLPEASMDFGFSLGVLHHVPDTAAALRSCASKLKAGAPFLVYLYYDLENRPGWYRLVWRIADAVRQVISRLPFRLRFFSTQIIAGAVYWPLARLAWFLERCGWDAGSIPLSYYRGRSFYAMRNDALDRFGTRLEQRFTAGEIRLMMEEAGFVGLSFNQTSPYWCVVGYKA